MQHHGIWWYFRNAPWPDHELSDVFLSTSITLVLFLLFSQGIKSVMIFVVALVECVFFFKRHYCQQLKRHHIRLMLRPCVPPAVDLEADTSLMFDASTFDILTVSDGSPSTRAVPTAQSHHVTSSHRIVLQNIPVHCTACRRTGEFVPLYIYIHNVVSWLVARFAIVLQKKLHPCIVWKVHYCGKKSWEAFFFVKK